MALCHNRGRGAMTDDLAFAQRLADAADAISARHVGVAAANVRTKPDGSPVSDVDVEVEQRLLEFVRRDRPDDGFLGEEVGTARSGRRRWIVDGIDGTVAYVAGLPEWSTLIALEDEGSLTIGVSSAPGLSKRWWAATGQSAWLRSLETSNAESTRLLRVSREGSLEAATIGVWPPPVALSGARRAAATRLSTTIPAIRSLAADEEERHNLRPSWGSGYPNAPLLVAAGLLDAVVLFGGGPWDIAALAVIVREAGGSVSDLAGDRRIDTAGAVYSNGHIHSGLIALLGLAAVS
jgi:histidinol-phosphatase